jgi:hypothetical protein
MTDTWAVSGPLDERWFDLPLDRDAALAELEPLVDAQVERQPELSRHRQRLLDALPTAIEEANEQGAIHAAIRWVHHPRLDEVSLATMCMIVFDRARPGPVADELDALQAGLIKHHATDRGRRTVERRHTGGGEAVRLHVITETGPGRDQHDEGRTVLLETVQYWLPVPGQADTLLVQFATPNLGMGEELVAEFDTIADHLELTQ